MDQVVTCCEGVCECCDHVYGLPTPLKPSFTPRPVGVGVKLWHTKANMEMTCAGASPTTTYQKQIQATTNMEKVDTMGTPCMGAHHEVSVNHSPHLDQEYKTNMEQNLTTNQFYLSNAKKPEGVTPHTLPHTHTAPHTTQVYTSQLRNFHPNSKTSTTKNISLLRDFSKMHQSNIPTYTTGNSSYLQDFSAKSNPIPHINPTTTNFDEYGCTTTITQT